MDTNSQPATTGSAADAGSALATISTNPQSEATLRALAERGRPLRVRVESPADMDVAGHQLNATPLTLRVLDEDDTEGHAISLHFPTADETKQFEERMLVTGALVGTLVIAGSGLALSQALPEIANGPATQAQTQAAPHSYLGSPSNPDAMSGKAQGLLNQIAGTDPEDVAVETPVNPAAGNISSNKGQAILDEITGTDGAK